MATQEEKERELISRFQQDPLVFRGAFVGMTGKEAEQIVRVTEVEIAQLDAEFNTAEAEMQKAAVVISSAKERLEDLKKGENFGAEFDSLLGNKKIAGIDFEPATGTPEYLVVTTAELCVPLGNKKYWIDPLKIKIYMRKGMGSISVHRAVPPTPGRRVAGGQYRGYYLTPHIPDGGRICYGNIEGDINRALRSQDWPLVIEFMISFLESCSPEGSHPAVLKEIANRVE